MLKSAVQCSALLRANVGNSVADIKVLNCLLVHFDSLHAVHVRYASVCVFVCAFVAHGLGVSESEGASNTTRTEANGHLRRQYMYLYTV